MSVANALQVALVTAIKADAGLTALISQRVHDWPGPDTVYPFVSVGDIVEEPWDDNVHEGSMCLVTIHTWARGAKSRQVARQIGEAANTLLHRNPAALTVAGHDVSNIQRGVSLVDYEGTGSEVTTAGVAHGIYRFEITTVAQ